MSDSSALRDTKQDALELNRNLERMIESAETMSVQLTWMAYEMVALRTSPELSVSMQRLHEAYQRCRDALCLVQDQDQDQDQNKDQNQEPEADQCPQSPATAPAQI